MDKQTNQPEMVAAQRYQDEDEINLMDLLLVLAKHNRFIIKFTVLAAVLSVVYVLMQANSYTAKTEILPPQQGASAASMMMAQLGGLGGLVGGAAGMKSPSDLYIGLLKSHTLADSLIARFKLQARFEAKTMEATRDALADATVIAVGKDGFITLEYTDKDPQFSATVANAYVDELDRLNGTVAITEAARKRLFFENQLKGSRANLDAAETALKQTQEKTGLIQLEKQGGAIIEAVANLRAQIASKEVELAGMRAFATESNPNYKQVQEVIVGLRTQLAKAEHTNIAGQGDVMVSTGKLPEVGLEYLRKTREMKYQETLFELLSKQFEMAKIDEAKSASLIQVVDKALVPERKSKPKRALTVILATMMAFFIGVLLAFFKEAAARASLDPAAAERMGLLRRYLRQGR